MKKMLLLFALFCPSDLLSAQDTIQGPALVAGYDDVSSGRNINLTFHYALNAKWRVSGGIKYMLNSHNYKYVHSVATPYFKEFTADNIAQHAGIKLGIERVLWQPNRLFSLSAFYDFQRTKANVAEDTKYWYSDTSFFFENMFSTRVRALEHTFGLSADIRVQPHMTFRVQGGIGFNMFYINKQQRWNGFDGASPYFAYTRSFRFALAYDLSDRKTTNEFGILTPSGQALSLSFDNIQTGRTLNMVYRRALNEHHDIYGGIKVQINSHLFDDHTRMGESYYFKQFRAEGLKQHLGLKAGYEYGLTVPRSNLYLFSFYDLQLSRAEVRNLVQLVEYNAGYNRAISGGSLGHLGYPIYKDPSTTDHQPSYRYIGPVTALENYIGVGAKMGITPQLQLRIQAGIGYNFYSGPDYYDPYYVLYLYDYKYVEKAPFNAPKSELSKMFSLGLDYAIGR